MEILYPKVMEVEGFNKTKLVEVFDYLQLHKSEAHVFMWKKWT